jgi:50S ribosomal subunit-associated GTPase HflX
VFDHLEVTGTNLRVVVARNKCDLESQCQVTAKERARAWTTYKTSAATGENVAVILRALAEAGSSESPRIPAARSAADCGYRSRCGQKSGSKCCLARRPEGSSETGSRIVTSALSYRIVK